MQENAQAIEKLRHLQNKAVGRFHAKEARNQARLVEYLQTEATMHRGTICDVHTKYHQRLRVGLAYDAKHHKHESKYMRRDWLNRYHGHIIKRAYKKIKRHTQQYNQIAENHRSLLQNRVDIWKASLGCYLAEERYQTQKLMERNQAALKEMGADGIILEDLPKVDLDIVI